MTGDDQERAPAEYVISHIQEALAQDARATELGVDVTLASGRAVLSGTVASAAHRDAIGQVAAEVARGYEIVNDLSVVCYDDAGEAEELA